MKPTTTRINRRVVAVIGLGVALPALLLGGWAILNTLRISQALDSQSQRYNSYISQQVADGYEKELLSHLRDGIASAEIVAREGGNRDQLVAALRRAGEGPAESPGFVPLEDLDDYFLLLVESQPLVYRSGAEDRAGRRFAGLMLRDATGQIIGAGGWWVNPRTFLELHLRPVVEERLANDLRMYGGIESRRHVAVTLLDPANREIDHMRTPGPTRNPEIARLEGPFEGYAIRVEATATAPIAGVKYTVMVQTVVIGLMMLMILVAAFFGLRYMVRQLELARIKSSFLANVSHELKTPIALIRLAVETLEMQRFSSPEEGGKFLRRIHRETERLNVLVENILDFARLEAGQRAFRFSQVDVVDLVRETMDSYRIRLEDQGFALRVELPDHLPPVRGDGPALAQCLLNLLDNAVKYSRQRKEIRVAAAERDGGVGISVQDRGIGIATRDHKRIFDKFVRIEDGLVHDVKGTGLGLSLVQQIIRAHNGRVELTSMPGEGSTFTLWLPRAPAEAAALPETEMRTGS
jgi:signal transduction histidine kinase